MTLTLTTERDNWADWQLTEALVMWWQCQYIEVTWRNFCSRLHFFNVFKFLTSKSNFPNTTISQTYLLRLHLARSVLHHTWEYLICNQNFSWMMELAKTRIPQEYFQTLHSQVKISPWQYFPTLSTSTCNLPGAKIRFTGASRCRPSLHRFSPLLLLPFTVLFFSQAWPAGVQCGV